MSTLQRQPALPDVIKEIREALMRPVLEASHKRSPSVKSRIAVAQSSRRPNETEQATVSR